MRKWRYFESYWHFTRTEFNACAGLACLTLFFLLLPCFYPLFFPNRERVDFSAFQAELAAFEVAQAALAAEEKAVGGFRSADRAQPAELFFFDPNTAAKEDFIRLGIAPRVAQAILNYRLKGGRFFKTEDFKKIYTLRQEDYERLKSWIKLETPTRQVAENERFEQQKNTFGSNDGSRQFAKFQAPPTTPTSLDINAATLEDWQKLSGIGGFYAKRIVNFREKLGGFSSVRQVGETFGLPDSTFQKILPVLEVSPVFRKIKVNSVPLEELKSHPYLSNFQATVLFNYRQQHGNFTNMESLKKMTAAFKDSDWTRLEPYLSFDSRRN